MDLGLSSLDEIPLGVMAEEAPVQPVVQPAPNVGLAGPTQMALTPTGAAVFSGHTLTFDAADFETRRSGRARTGVSNYNVQQVR